MFNFFLNQDDTRVHKRSRIFRTVVDSLAFGSLSRKHDIYQAERDILTAYYTPGEVDVDYSNPDVRDAYCLLYLASHINLSKTVLHNVLKSGSRFRNLLNHAIEKKAINMVSIGGGPGSDVLGLLLFLKECEIEGIHVNCIIHDLYDEWFYTFKQFTNTGYFSWLNSCTVTYYKYDFTQGVDQKMHENLLKADIVTFMKSVSSFPQVQGFNANLTEVLRHIPNGSALIYIDNINSKHESLVAQLARDQFKCVFKIVGRVDMQTADKKDIHEFRLLPKKEKPPIISQCHVRIQTQCWMKMYKPYKKCSHPVLEPKQHSVTLKSSRDIVVRKNVFGMAAFVILAVLFLLLAKFVYDFYF